VCRPFSVNPIGRTFIHPERSELRRSERSRRTVCVFSSLEEFVLLRLRASPSLRFAQPSAQDDGKRGLRLRYAPLSPPLRMIGIWWAIREPHLHVKYKSIVGADLCVDPFLSIQLGALLFILSGESFEEANEVEGRRAFFHRSKNLFSFDYGLHLRYASLSPPLRMMGRGGFTFATLRSALHSG